MELDIETEPLMRTVNGDVIKPNLMVFTYDYRWGKVHAKEYERRLERINKSFAQDLRWSDDFWFDVHYSDGSWNMYNGERMTTMCPNCRGDFEACNRSGCGQRKEANWTGWNA